MSTLPLTEAILLEIHQSLGCPSYPTTKKNKFATGQDRLEAHKAMGEEILHAIFDALDMDPRARMDAIDNLTEFGNVYKYRKRPGITPRRASSNAAAVRPVRWQAASAGA